MSEQAPTLLAQQCWRGDTYRQAVRDLVKLIERRAPRLLVEAQLIEERALDEAWRPLS